MNHTVYLAGPIDGLSYNESVNWRKKTTNIVNHLSNNNIKCLSPMRGKYYLDTGDEITGTYEEHPLSTGKAITHRDFFDVRRADVIFVNLIGAKKVSIGTILECGAAHALNKPIILLMEDDNIHRHAMLENISGWILNNLEDGIKVLLSVLLPYDINRSLFEDEFIKEFK